MNNASEKADKPVGLTAETGYQIGVRRTLPMERGRIWRLLLSAEGLSMWLGDLASIELKVGEKYTTRDGAAGEIRVIKPEEQIRLTWQPSNWARPSTNRPEKTTVSFHQENLANGLIREEMKERSERALAWLAGKDG